MRKRGLGDGKRCGEAEARIGDSDSPERAKYGSPGQGDAQRCRSPGVVDGQPICRPSARRCVCVDRGRGRNEVRYASASATCGPNKRQPLGRFLVAVVTQGCVRRWRTCPGLTDFALAGLKRSNRVHKSRTAHAPRPRRCGSRFVHFPPLPTSCSSCSSSCGPRALSVTTLPSRPMRMVHGIALTP